MLRPVPLRDVEMLTQVCDAWSEGITDDHLSYLVDQRKLNPSVVREAKLGSVPQDIDPFWHRYAGMIAIPYIVHNDIVVDVRFRVPPGMEGDSKYLTRTGSASRLYGVGQIEKAEHVICITEGELDSLALRSCGIPAIASPGASNVKEHHALLVDQFEYVLIWCDHDKAGAEFGGRWKSLVPDARLVIPPTPGTDVNDVLIDSGIEGIKELYYGHIR